MKQPPVMRFIMVILYLFLAGCGRSTPPDTVSFSNEALTAIAGTAQAANHLTQTAAPPTAIPATATPIISPISGSSLSLQADGSTRFFDHRAGIQVLVPANWLPIRVNEDEFYKAFTNETVMGNQAIIDHLTQVQDGDINYFRLVAIDLRPEHTVDGLTTYINVVFQKDDMRTLKEWLQAERANKRPFKGYKFLASSIEKLADGREVLIIEESWNGGATSTIYYRGVFFLLPTGTVVLDFYTNQQLKDQLLPEFQQVVDSLQPLSP